MNYEVSLTPLDKAKIINTRNKLLCNWTHCTFGPRNGIAPAERLCPFCFRVGWCCVHCMTQDIYGHCTHECQENKKKIKYKKIVKKAKK
ncbi:hypothetical protein OAG24_00295 [bacterium]|nr:hypothetical protein [bacterium]